MNVNRNIVTVNDTILGVPTIYGDACEGVIKIYTYIRHIVWLVVNSGIVTVKL